MWQHFSVFAGEACSGETTDCERPNTSTAARVGTLLLEGRLGVRGSTLRYLRGPPWIGDHTCSGENPLPFLCHNRAKRNSKNTRPRVSAAPDSRPDPPAEFLTSPARQS